MAKKGLVYLKHKVKTYRGNDYESFVGSIKVGNKEILLSINAENGSPKVVDGEYRGKETSTIFVNAYEIDPKNKQSGRRKNEF